MRTYSPGGRYMYRYCSSLTIYLKRLALVVLAIAGATSAQTPVLTQHNNNARTGAYTTETILTPANVNQTTFGKLFSMPVDGRVYAQPLYVPNVTIPGKGAHNVVYVATEHDSVYAFDADSNGGVNSAPLWRISLLDAAHGAASGAQTVPNGDISSADLTPEIGVTSTPVIDTSKGAIYVVSKSREGTTASPIYVQRLHALDITTGAEKFGGPVTIAGSVPGTGNGTSGSVLNFDPKWQLNRAGLLLQNGVVYLAWGSHGDNGPWHGWVMSYNAATLAQLSVYCTTPNGSGSGIWMAGTGLAGDVIDAANKPYGRLFIATGNGSFNATPPYTNAMNYGDDLIRLDLSGGVLTVQDSFTPSNQGALNGADLDVSSGGVLLLPDQSTGGHTHLMVQAGKEGKLYIVDRDNMGGFSANTDNVVQEISGQTGGLWSIPAFWNNKLYTWGKNNNLQAFTLSNGQFSTTPTATGSFTSSYPGASPSVSSNGNSNGIVWAIKTDAYNTAGPAILFAFDASNIATELYDSAQNAARDSAGLATKFSFPTIANGKVYVTSANELGIYGLLAAAPIAATPVISPASQSFSGTLSVTITDSTSGATIYYTVDGSKPTAASAVYTGAISVSSTQTVSAIASASGFLQSAVGSQTYTLQNQVVKPVLSPGSTAFSSPMQITMSDATAGAKIYYTTDGSTPTSASTLYSGAITISSTTSISAIAMVTGMVNSPIATATYTYSNGTGSNFVNGFGTATSMMTFNGATTLADTRLQLTDGGFNESSSAWFNTPLNVQSFTNDFTFQVANAGADGFTFTIQNAGLNAVGSSGGGLGYGSDTPGGPAGILKSVAIKFDFYNNQGEGGSSTGLYTNGASPTIPAVDLTGAGVVLGNGDTFAAHMVYDGTTLTLTITDGVTNTSFTTSWTINIPQIVGGNTAYVGFTAGSGGQSSSQKIETWTFSPTTASQAQTATPTFSPAAGTYTGAQTVSISDGTSGAAIYYTVDGTTPATSAGGSTAKYTGAISVTSSETIKAIATASGLSNSVVASAAYAIQFQAASPTFTPTPGSYTSTQSVSLSSTTAGSSIYYTLDGSTPNTSAGGSTFLYASPITVSSTRTVKALAIASGLLASPVASATYTIGAVAGNINFGNGFAGGGMIFNGSTALNGTRLRLTDGGGYEAASAWYSLPVSLTSFANDFSFQITPGTSPIADGMAFVIQNNNTAAIGPLGGGLGYGSDTYGVMAATAILKSVAIKFDLYGNSGESANSTGLYINGASPTNPCVDLTGTPIDLHSGHVFNVHMTYDGATLTMTITDTVTAGTFTQSWPINLATTIGNSTAYFGFTGGTGGLTAIQEIINWTYSSGGTLSNAATPTFSPAAGTYTSAQSVTISDTTSGATIYYTTDGSTPTPASTKYTGAISVGATTTLNAIAIATGFNNSTVATATYTIQLPTATPTFSPGAGTYAAAQSVTISAAPSATIYYTTDGSTPTTASTKYTAAVSVASSLTLKAIATAAGSSNSAVATAAYVIQTPAATPTFSPVAGTYAAAQSVTISDTTAGATIYYTTDGTTPTTASTKYTAAISVGATTTIKAIATATGFNNSAVASALYTIQLPAATPTFSPAAGTYASAQSVTISDTTSGATIYYTTDGSTPTPASTKYTTPVSVASSLTLKAIATAAGFSNSAVGSAAYAIQSAAATPTFSPAAGTYTAAQSVTISDSTAGATIYFTTDGTTPTTASTKYTGAISVGATTTIKALATATGFNNSTVATALYTIQLPAATPTFSPAGGTYSTTQSVTIGDSTAGATIYYTTDGSTPTTASTKYTAPVSVASSLTLKAIATAAGFSNSAVGSAAYTISGSSTLINFGGGFASSNGLQLNGGSALNGTRLRLTDAGTMESRSAFWTAPVNVQAFTTDFTFQQAQGTNPTGDGFAFVLQNVGATALGPAGGGLGYGPDAAGSTNPQSILNSIAIKFDLYSNSGEGADSTGLYVNGASPTTPAVDMSTSTIDLHSGHVFAAHITYDGTTLTLKITDTTTSGTFTTSWPINIPSTIGSSTVFVGFTAGTGGATAIQDVITWSYSASAAKTPITYSATSLSPTGSGPTVRSFAYSGFPDGSGIIMDATAIGDNVTFTVNIPQAGTYDLVYTTKKSTNRGTTQLSIGGVNVGPATDQYNGADAYGTLDLGNFSFPSAGNYSFKFTVTGKNTSSTSYQIDFDDFILTPQ